MKIYIAACLAIVIPSMLIIGCKPVERARIIHAINSLKYESPREVDISDDIEIIGPVTIYSYEIARPRYFLLYGVSPCIYIENEYHHGGIEIEELSSGNDEPYCEQFKITFTDVTVRFRKIFYPSVPIGGKFYLYILHPTDYVCDDYECEIDDVCYTSYFDYCQFCLDMSERECVCRNSEGIYPDGTECDYVDDVVHDSECQNGTCMPIYDY